MKRGRKNKKFEVEWRTSPHFAGAALPRLTSMEGKSERLKKTLDPVKMRRRAPSHRISSVSVNRSVSRTRTRTQSNNAFAESKRLLAQMEEQLESSPMRVRRFMASSRDQLRRQQSSAAKPQKLALGAVTSSSVSTTKLSLGVELNGGSLVMNSSTSVPQLGGGASFRKKGFDGLGGKAGSRLKLSPLDRGGTDVTGVSATEMADQSTPLPHTNSMRLGRMGTMKGSSRDLKATASDRPMLMLQTSEIGAGLGVESAASPGLRSSLLSPGPLSPLTPHLTKRMSSFRLVEKKAPATEHKDKKQQHFYSMMRQMSTNPFKGQVGKKRRPPSPSALYLNECKRLGVVPEPFIAKVALDRRAKTGPTVKLRGYNMGDDLISAIAAAVHSSVHLRHVDIAGNRLTNKGFEKIFEKVDKDMLRSLDISHNPKISAHPRSMRRLNEFVRETTSLMKLGLEDNHLTDIAIRDMATSIGWKHVCPLSGVLLHECSLTSVNLSRNQIGDEGAKALGAAITENNQLTELDLSWNRIRSLGAAVLFAALPRSKLVSLDVAWNSIGSSGDKERKGATALAKSLRQNKTLTHLNVGHNQLSERDCRLMAQCLRENHILMGLHVEGNYAEVDAHGFLIPDAEVWPSETSHCFTRILAPQVVGRENWSQRSNCWLCEKWRPHTFTYDPGHDDLGKLGSRPPEQPDAFPSADTDVVYLCTSFDKWKPEAMAKLSVDVLEVESDLKKRPVFQISRMVPPGDHTYCFVVGAAGTVAFDQPLPPPVDGANAARIEEIQEHTGKRVGVSHRGRKCKVLLPYQKNLISMEPPSTLPEDEAAYVSSIKPRMRNANPEFMEDWTFARSVFGQFHQDTEELLDTAFEIDWSMTKMPRVVQNTLPKDVSGFKLEQTVATVKATLRSYYRVIKGIFRHYAAAFAAEIFSLGGNGYNEFLYKATIMEPKRCATGVAKCSRTDAEMTFIPACMLGPKGANNHQKSLCRFQFLQVIAVLADIRYRRTGVEATLVDAIRRFMEEDVLPHAERDDSEWYRWTLIYNEPVDKLLKKNLPMLQQVYARFSGRENLPSEPKTMSFHEWTELIDTSGLMDDGDIFGDRAMKLAYIYSQETETNEMTGASKHRETNFGEFLEAVTRVAYMRECNILDSTTERVRRRSTTLSFDDVDALDGAPADDDAKADLERLSSMSSLDTADNPDPGDAAEAKEDGAGEGDAVKTGEGGAVEGGEATADGDGEGEGKNGEEDGDAEAVEEVDDLDDLLDDNEVGEAENPEHDDDEAAAAAEEEEKRRVFPLEIPLKQVISMLATVL